MMSTKDADISFLAPTVTNRFYIAKGPSGWVETFDKRKLDQELKAFIAPADLGTLINMFQTARKLNEAKGPTDWFTVTGFLARMKTCHPRDIPHTVAIAFWGNVIEASNIGLN